MTVPDKFTAAALTLLGLYQARYKMHEPAAKEAFHKHGKKLLKELAKLIGAEEFDVRSNKAGPAVVGEVTLHTPHVYVQLTGGSCQHVMFRECKGMKDYTGGMNQWASMEDFIGTDRMVKRIRNLQRVAA